MAEESPIKDGLSMRVTTRLPVAILLAVTGIASGQSGRGGRQGAAQTPPSLEELPVIGIANVTFKVTDLDKARVYYQRILGFAEAFDLKDQSGEVVSAYFKVNDDQYIEITPTLKPGELNREERIVFQSTDLGKLHALYTSRGLNPSKIQKGLDGNPSFRVVSPEGNNLDFLQYAEGSEQAKARGRFLSPDRISTHLWHVGVMTKETAILGPFYRERLGFTNLRFGTRGEYVETPGRDSKYRDQTSTCGYTGHACSIRKRAMGSGEPHRNRGGRHARRPRPAAETGRIR
jgi:lactoylglutathione lyase